MAIVVSMINMKGGVGKSTLTFNLAWRLAWQENKRILAIDLDPQANLSQYFLGAQKYLDLLTGKTKTVHEIFEQFSSPSSSSGSPTILQPKNVIKSIIKWSDGSLIDLIASRLELSWTLKNPTEKAHLLPLFISKIQDQYDFILIDCAPTESILTTAAYLSSKFVFVPVKPEFLATIGLPLLGRSLQEFGLMHQNQNIKMGGIIFNDMRRTNTPKEQISSIEEVKKLAQKNSWPVFTNIAYHSDSYPAGSRDSSPIFQTNYARDYVKREFNELANEFLTTVSVS